MASNLTAAHLKKIMPNAPAGDIEAELDLCIATAVAYDIRTKVRFAAWIANVAKESGELYYVEELADGWAYEGRADLGNIYPGDGPRYKGHGYIQITGRANHRVVGRALGIDAEANPSLLTEVPHAWASAGYYWRHMSSWGDLNTYADDLDFESTVFGVRGGPDPGRRHYYDTALSILPSDLYVGGEAQSDPLPTPPTVWPALEAKVSKSGYLYHGEDWIQLPSLMNGKLETDAEGWIYIPLAAPEPEPQPTKWEWPVANDAPIPGGWYWQEYPTRYTFRPDVEKICREMIDKYPGQVWANTYYHHPPDVYPPSREADSVDFWSWNGRGYALDVATGNAIWEELFNRTGKPDWDWGIWQGWMWSRKQGGWVWWGDHYDHLHITFI